jgi:hypothetical protein
MKTNKIFAMAALAATAITAASCQKGTETGGQEGVEASMGLTISFPKNTETRASDSNASDQDMIVDKIDVFIFNADGTAATGNNMAEKSHFENISGTNTWKLKEANLITTTTGNKKIYVGINRPAGLEDAASESVLTTKFEITVGALYSNTDASKGVAMLSGMTAKTIGTNSNNNHNDVTVTVSRMPAKVTATLKNGFVSVPTAVTDPKFTVDPDQFTVGNTALSVYPVKRLNGQSFLITPGDTDNNEKTDQPKVTANLDLTNNPQLAINPESTANKDKNSYYVPENSTSTQFLRKEATYAVVRGELKPTHYSKLDGNAIKEDIAVTTPFTGSVWAVKYSGKVYFTDNTDDCNAIVSKLGITNPGANTIQEYIPVGGKLYTFYYVFLAENETDKLAVQRNHIYDVLVKSVKGIGQPGLPQQPTDPDEPVYTYEAELDVEVLVEDWKYVKTETDLQ